MDYGNDPAQSGEPQSQQGEPQYNSSSASGYSGDPAHPNAAGAPGYAGYPGSAGNLNQTPHAKPERSSMQIVTLALGIIFLAIGAFGIVLLIATYTVDLQYFGGVGYRNPQSFGYTTGYAMGMPMAAFTAAGIAGILLGNKVTKPRIAVNGVLAALMWVAFLFSLPSTITSIHRGYDFIQMFLTLLIQVIFPLLYTMCVVSCNSQAKKAKDFP